MKIKSYNSSEFDELYLMAKALYPNYETDEELIRDLRLVEGKKNHQIYFAMEENQYAGFMVVSVRTDYVEGASSSPTGYLEAIFIKPDFRKMGIAKQLFQKAESWVKDKGCIEMGSDTWLDHKEAQDFHIRLGFKEDDRLVHYIKTIDQDHS
jgi:aminoglycoside 6'-N-acetyltransferase I